MYDFHVHISLNGTGLAPAEAMRLGAALGYRGLVLALRSDLSDTSLNIPALKKSLHESSLYSGVEAFLGIELVHVPPQLMAQRVETARSMGFDFILVHGETLADNVLCGTNIAAIEAGVDMLAHPGLLRPEEALLAAQKNVALELSSCPRHALANGLLAKIAEACTLLPGGNVHTRADMLPAPILPLVHKAAGLDAQSIQHIQLHAQQKISELLLKK